MVGIKASTSKTFNNYYNNNIMKYIRLREGGREGQTRQISGPGKNYRVIYDAKSKMRGGNASDSGPGAPGRKPMTHSTGPGKGGRMPIRARVRAVRVVM